MLLLWSAGSACPTWAIVNVPAILVPHAWVNVLPCITDFSGSSTLMRQAGSKVHNSSSFHSTSHLLHKILLLHPLLYLPPPVTVRGVSQKGFRCLGYTTTCREEAHVATLNRVKWRLEPLQNDPNLTRHLQQHPSQVKWSCSSGRKNVTKLPPSPVS